MNPTIFILLLFLVAGCDQPASKPAETTEGISIASMAEESIDSSMINTLDAEIQKGTYPNIHSLLIARNNKMVFEKYWPGKDESWGMDRGIVAHAKDSLHDIRSISKSIVSTCVGIIVTQGKIKSVDQKIFDFFPEHKKFDTGLKSSLTIKHLLTMTSGLVWNEEVPYDDPENSEIKMVRSPDPIGFVLSQPMSSAPGTVWKYNGGTTQLLAAIIEKLSGMKVDKFAQEYLFKPLDIKTFEWAKYPGTNDPAAASGLRLRSRDLLKFGLMYNNQGKWNDQQIVPVTWVEQSFKSYIQRPGYGGYGYQFWIGRDSIQNKPVEMVLCVGNGDQRIYFDKKNELVVVVTAGNYNKWDIKKNADAMIKDYVYPAVVKK